jgi:hypothetical protein
LEKTEKPPYSVLFKNTIREKPWLFIIAYYVYSYPGLSIEELKNTSGLKIDVVKRGVWWLRKVGVVEERNNKYYISTTYSKVLESTILNTCRLGDTLILLLDEVYIVYRVTSGRIQYWSIPLKYYEEIAYYERATSGSYTPSNIAQILGVDLGTAKKVHRLFDLIKKCGQRLNK